jgi:uncharacterized protein
MMVAENIQVENNEAAHRYEAHVDGRLAQIVYEREGDRIAYLHTEVPEELEGRGIAGQMTKVALDEAREQGLTVVPLCPYVSGYIRRHPAYLDIVDEAYRARLQ